MATATIQSLIEDFGLLDDWEDRYRYVIELGKTLPPLTAAEHNDKNKVRGCASQVWLVKETARNGEPVLTFRGDSDAHIVRGLIAILLALYSGRPAREIAETDPEAVFRRMGLREHLTAQRSNGLSSMVARIRSEAQSELTGSQVMSGL
jgi:cysteine desulfuration protein SufE